MKSIYFAILTLLLAHQASATCFDIVGRNQLTRLGSISLSSPAKKICFDSVKTFRSTAYLSLGLYNKTGDLAFARGIEQVVVGCESFCTSSNLISGNVIGGTNTNLMDTRIRILTQTDTRLGAQKNAVSGFLEIQSGNNPSQKFSIEGMK